MEDRYTDGVKNAWKFAAQKLQNWAAITSVLSTC